MVSELERQASFKPTDLSRSIKVVAAGYSRTGTVSLCLALEKLLDGPVCHSGSACAFREVGFIRSWVNIMSPGPQATPAMTKSKLKDILAGFVATADAPSILFVKELVEIYPEAKVVCTYRDKDRWWASFQVVMNLSDQWWLDILCLLMPVSWYHQKKKRATKERSNLIYPGGYKHGPELMQIHNEYVKSSVPADRLLFFDVKEGWGPLCKFLDLPIPDEPFPNENNTESFQKQAMTFIKIAAMRWLWLFAGIGAVTAIGIHALQYR